VRYRLLLLVTSYCLLVTVFGCEAFVQKFTRKPKTEDIPEEEMVVAPQEYEGKRMSREEEYRQYFLFWRSWQDELIVSMQDRKSQKKFLDCAEQAIKNLEGLRALLTEEAQEKLDVYIRQEKALQDSIEGDSYGNNIPGNISTAERIKRRILKDFSYKKIADQLASL
jgi:hypothetical protein